MNNASIPCLIAKHETFVVDGNQQQRQGVNLLDSVCNILQTPVEMLNTHTHTHALLLPLRKENTASM